MYQVHGFACVKVMRPHCFTSQLARIQRTHAAALKPPHEAGGRGGESTARWRWCGFYFFSV
ncbi:hypothetical protein FGG75_20980 [Escherichia coli]|nr:hypothetical protein [Escherichia coli]TMQ92969.1 hypothetical protein FGG75_20980 [Escherichia coli]